MTSSLFNRYYAAPSIQTINDQPTGVKCFNVYSRLDANGAMLAESQRAKGIIASYVVGPLPEATQKARAELMAEELNDRDDRVPPVGPKHTAPQVPVGGVISASQALVLSHARHVENLNAKIQEAIAVGRTYLCYAPPVQFARIIEQALRDGGYEFTQGLCPSNTDYANFRIKWGSEGSKQDYLELTKPGGIGAE